MDDFYLCDTVDHSTIFVSALSQSMYRAAGGQGLGGSEGYFVCMEDDERPDAGFEILAKANTPEAARMIFTALLSDFRQRQVAV